MRGLLRRVLPRTLASRTALFLLLALMAVQAAGLTIHALDRVDLQRAAMERETSSRIFGLWRTMVVSPPDRRAAMLAELEMPEGLEASLETHSAVRAGMLPAPPPVLRMVRPDILLGGPPRWRAREVQAGMGFGTLYVAALLPDGSQWVNLKLHMPPLRPWHSETFLVAFLLMTAAAAALILWATRRLTRPVRDLARAANALGRDVNAPPMPEDGPLEVSTAAHAFNTMAGRIRRFVGDRTQMLAAIGHDLRTPITRLKLRAEFMEDEEQRTKMLSDLEEMEAMINATLAFSRDDAAAEPSVPLDLAALCRTVLDEAADARPDAPAETFAYEGPERLTVRGRPIALKRALANLVANAANYGNAARVVLVPPAGFRGAGVPAGMQGQPGQIQLRVEDEGPGIPVESQEAVFQPFRRLETSRNRETGGVGLGLPIARNILRAHGGDVVLENRPGGGLLAVATLPA